MTWAVGSVLVTMGLVIVAVCFVQFFSLRVEQERAAESERKTAAEFRDRMARLDAPGAGATVPGPDATA